MVVSRRYVPPAVPVDPRFSRLRTDRAHRLLPQRAHTHAAGRLPNALPHVCIQLPIFNEDTVFERIIDAAAALDWPKDRLVIQVLDDSTDLSTHDRVRAHCMLTARQRGVTCRWMHRIDRTGYKAGALEAGRHRSDAEFILILDADFVGIWRATAIEAAGGWRSASLVEDCELSFRALFTSTFAPPRAGSAGGGETTAACSPTN